MSTFLQFSGGADSLATLFVKREQWPDLCVVWCDTGRAYHATHALMEKIAALVPRFHVVRSDKAAWEAEHGVAVDLVPERFTPLGHVIHGTTPPPLFTSPWACCGANIWAPMHRAMLELGATVVIRGQRNEERRKGPIKSGHTQDGVRYEFPIEDWTREQVFDFCKRECPELLPSYYAQGEKSSHDCWDCLAYLDDNRERIANLQGEMREVMHHRLDAYHRAIRPEFHEVSLCHTRTTN